MPYIEQLLYGHDQRAETNERQQLALSAGMGADVASEVCALCDNWGQSPELGLNRSALMSMPLAATMPSMRGRLFAVIHVRPGTVPLFHAVVITGAAYSGFGRNPYSLASVLTFCDEWNGRDGMDRVEVDGDGIANLFDPPANPEDVGLIDEAVLQFISTGRLELPLEQSVRESDRALALMIACLPQKDRKELRFASFTTVKVNAYDLCCVETEGAMFAGWKRLMLARIDTGVNDCQEEYKSQIVKYLSAGDLAGIERVSSRHDFKVAPAANPMVASRQGTAPAEVGASARSAPAAPAAASPAFGPAATLPTGPVAPTASRPAAPPRSTVQRSTVVDHGLDPTMDQFGQAIRNSFGRRRRVRSGRSLINNGRGSSGRFLRTVSVLVLVFIAGWVGTMWLEGRTLRQSLEWAGLPGMDGRIEETSHAGTLLEVVDVGHVYDRAMKHVGNKGLGLNAAGDKGREKALKRLKLDATDPLVGQVSLFVKLSDEGIQQSGRQDREVERLKSLAEQGTVLQKEMARLELAWYSLTTGANWRDLGRISDRAVVARSDSLVSVDKRSLTDIRTNMGTTELRAGLDRARQQMDGMAGVVALFQSKRWSADWERDLAAAAEKVSPTAGTVTRAYRNSAFALLRLKRAEREAANRELPYAMPFAAERWPSSGVRSVLPLLRREAGRFAHQSAPRMLSATLGLYSALENSDRTIEKIKNQPAVWHKLQDNAALAFDPDLYGAFLGRLRFEAAQRTVRQGTAPEDIPTHLFARESTSAAVAFADSLKTLTRAEQWQSMATALTDPFLVEWADHMADKREARLAYLRSRFTEIWTDCRAKTVSLQAAAKGGYDWSESWRDLYRTANEAKAEYTPTLWEDPSQQPKLAYLDTLAQALVKPLPLHLTRVTVRLEKARLDDPREVQIQLRAPDHPEPWTSDPFLMGPSAPEETGWVGTTFLDWNVPVAGLDHLTVRVVTLDGEHEMLRAFYPSLADGVGVSGLARVRSNDAGSIGFKADWSDYWQALSVPDLGPVF